MNNVSLLNNQNMKGGDGGEKEKRLLCISDLEGCNDEGEFAGSSILCQSETFNTIKEFLNNANDNYENHVVFLGDYFDQGKHMIKSINGIGMLIDEFIIKTHRYYEKNPRLNIILGNRDINKMRILYEAVTPFTYIDPDTMWGDWKVKFKDNTNLKDSIIAENNKQVTKIQELLNAKNGTTFGAPNLLSNIIKECGELELSINELDAIYIIGKIFIDDIKYLKENLKHENLKLNDTIDTNATINTFIQSARKIFYYGKLINNFNFDTNNNILMSHAGSYSPYIFNINATFYDNIDIYNGLNNTNFEINNYYAYIENCRKMFVEKNVIENSIEENVIENSVDENDKLLKPKIENINYAYDKFIKTLFEGKNSTIFEKKNSKIIAKQKFEIKTKVNYVNGIKENEHFRKYYFIIQALGLNITLNSQEKFVSPIASCGITPKCLGFEETNDDIIKLFSKNKIKYVVNGHVPHCATVPIIYKRSSTDKNHSVVFVNNDTSVGYTPGFKKLRKTDPNTNRVVFDTLGDSLNRELENIPLSYVTKNIVGISSLVKFNNSIILDRKNTQGYDLDGNQKDKYQLLINDWEYINTPYFFNKETIQSENFMLKKTSMFNPLEITEISKGGKKSRRRKGKSGRVSKRRNKKVCKNMKCKRCG